MLKSQSKSEFHMMYAGILACIAILCIIGFKTYGGGNLAWILVFLIFLLPASERSLHHNPIILYTVWLVIAIHQVVAITNIHYITLPGAGTDALTFHICASRTELAEITLAIGEKFYCNFLAITYHFLGNSHFLAVQLSVFAFTLSLILFNRLLEIKGIDTCVPVLLIIFGLLPHILVYTSISLREPWQLLFFISAVYYGIRFKQRSDFLGLVFFLLSSFCLALLHQVLFLFSFVFIALFILWPLDRLRILDILKRAALIIPIIGLISYLAITALTVHDVSGRKIILRPIHSNVNYFLWRLGEYRTSINERKPRTQYSHELDTSSVGALIISFPKHYLQYTLVPLLKSENTFDLTLSINNLIRLGLLLIALYGIFLGRDRRWILLLFSLYILMTCTWVLGSTNYGQASRHHVLSDWLLILIAGIVLFSNKSKREPIEKTDHS